MTISRPLFVLVLLAMSGRLSAQEDAATSEPALLSAATFLGGGSGPNGSVVWGVEGMVPLSRFLALRAEYTRWGSGSGYCVQSFPDSYACSVVGWAGLAGLRATLPLNGRIRPFIDASGGRFSRSSANGEPASAAVAVSVGGGALLQVYGGLSARLGASVLRSFDDDYESLMREKLQYVAGTIGLEYQFVR